MELARSVSGEIRIVGQRDKLAAFAPIVVDIFPECGPLGGIHAALTATTCELNLMLAVDTPFITTELLRHLVGRAQTAAALVTVPRVNGRFQPLCAVYRREFLHLAEEALQTGRNKIDLLFRPGIADIVDDSELARLEFPAAMFDNLNTREDLQKALRRTHD
jgi:molybdopterin-guanine dinucleotide biosynthesis protein A